MPAPECLAIIKKSLELLDFSRSQAARIARQLALDDRHQEVEPDDVDHRHGKDRRIGKVDHGSKLRGGTDHHEDTEDDLEDQLFRLAFADDADANTAVEALRAADYDAWRPD